MTEPSTKVDIWTIRIVALCLLLIVSTCSALPEVDLCGTIASISVGKREAAGCWDFWLNRYQSAFGGIATLAAAIVAYLAVKSQTRSSEALARAGFDREALAARVRLAQALGDLCAFADDCRLALRSFRLYSEGLDLPLALPQFPETTIEPVSHAARFSEPPITADVTDLATLMQVVKSRCRSLSIETSADDRVNTGVDQAMYDCADLYVKASRLFWYARDTDEPLANRPTIASTLLFWRVEENDWPPLYARLRVSEPEGID